MKLLLKPGASQRIGVGNVGNMNGRLGEEVMGINTATQKAQFPIKHPLNGTVRKVEPDDVIGTLVLEAKNKLRLTSTDESHIMEYVQLAGEMQGSFQLGLRELDMVNAGFVDDLVDIYNAASGTVNGLSSINVTTFAEILDTAINMRIVAVAGVGQVANSLAHD